MKHTWTEPLFDRMGRLELPWCLALNRISLRAWGRAFFAAVSRLGNGVFWYTLMAALVAVHGAAALPAVARMIVTGLVGVTVYKALKRGAGRPRPFVRHREVCLGTVPLDRYSFPSGHTLHAVAFTLIAVQYDPVLALLLVPFTVLVALSRVVLGLHYPSDVLAGAAVGALTAWGGGLVLGLF